MEMGGGGDPKKRRLTHEQVEGMELRFQKKRKVEKCRKVHLTVEIQLDTKQVAVWFENRRRATRASFSWRSSPSSITPDAAILRKCNLDNEC
ncbi:hypothetical protein ZWY2020_054878 [Hordeum vulgare]|nr:hypothetical protein ZWY2020_054878 [Hordeum vulgare]